MIWNKAIFLLLAMAVGWGLTINSALAHRFNVALVIPLSNDVSVPGSTLGVVQGQQIRAGFMLATTERDSHPDQESDGHLGGLDVYVSVIDSAGDFAADIGRIVTTDEIDIVAAFGSETTLSQIRKLLAGTEITLLLPGEKIDLGSELPAVARFVSAFERANGEKPSVLAAQGYNTARRIAAAVRDQGGVDDKASLLEIFRQTGKGFSW